MTTEPRQAVVGYPGGIRVRWRVGHSDLVAGVELIGGRLVLTSYAGFFSALDPATGCAPA